MIYIYKIDDTMGLIKFNILKKIIKRDNYDKSYSYNK